MQLLTAFAGKNRFLFVGIRAKIVGLSFERNLCDPLSVFTIKINTRMSAGIAGKQTILSRLQNGHGRTINQLQIVPVDFRLQAAAAFRSSCLKQGLPHNGLVSTIA